MHLIAFCEARADFEIASGLIDRVLRDQVDWVGDVLDADADGVRTWHHDGAEHPFWANHELRSSLKRHNVRPPLGHFDGAPGGESAIMARNAFALSDVLARTRPIDGVVLISDMDDEPAARRAGLNQAREADASDFKIVIGCPNAKREAWVLAAFSCEGEESALAELRHDLGFSPIEHSHQLDAQKKDAKRSAKRVLSALTGGSLEREARAWQSAELDVLRSREACGLSEFLAEVEDHLVPLLQRT